jgi:hypothetical protein
MPLRHHFRESELQRIPHQLVVSQNAQQQTPQFRLVLLVERFDDRTIELAVGLTRFGS